MSPKVTCHFLGRIDYKAAWEFQEKLFQEGVQQKIAVRNGESTDLPKNHLIFCEHPHVFTLGKSGDRQHLLIDQTELDEKEAQFYQINRGGDITYHGPGQLVVYPIFDLEQFFTDIHKYMRFLEEAVIRSLANFGIQGDRFAGMTGVWLEPTTPKARKICAMGVKSSRWMTMHGIGFNICTDLSFFNHIVPCGIQDKAVTSVEKELNRSVSMDEITPILLKELTELFGFEVIADK
ncbi:MAG: lipoyl(octanoyl) transferase LipB [Crocinitomicaceae bacterium]|nr:lipoyl(octanoyl) transferase LipB [Crocinitomicaceae bacterium]MCF8410083.1 lipoyl(octanoyl) transferase LipB [Crocinitomicaceae bacterium]